MCVDITHTPQSPVNPAFNHQLSSSIQRTIGDYIKARGLPQVINDPYYSRFTLGINDAQFQANIGNHATLIESISVYIPYAYDSITSQQESVDNISYGTDTTVYFQWRVRYKSNPDSEPQAEAWVSVAIDDVDGDGFDTYLKGKADSFVTANDLGTLEDLIETFDERPSHIKNCFQPWTGAEPLDLDIDIHAGFIILKVTKLIDTATRDRLTTSFQQQQLVRNETDLGQTQFGLGMVGAVLHNSSLINIKNDLVARKPPALIKGNIVQAMSIEECSTYCKDMTVAKTRARFNGMIACGLGLFMGVALMGRNNNGIERAIMSVAMAFLTGPIGAIAGFL